MNNGVLRRCGMTAAAAAPIAGLLWPLASPHEGDTRMTGAHCGSDALACERLHRLGYAVIPGAELADLATTLDVQRRRQAAVEVTAGRLHLELLLARRLASSRGDVDTDAARLLETINARVAPPLRALACRYLGTDEVMLTQAQFLDSAPGAVAQGWHRDNARRGLTFLIPLAHISTAMGATELLPSSHADGAAPAAVSRLLRCAPLDVGDVLCYDSRLLHRGGANVSPERRRVLVLRFDDPATPPPGVGLLGALAQRAAGGAWSRAAGLLYAFYLP